MSLTWCVAYTQPSKEFQALQNLKDQGYEVYLPRFKKLCRHARRVQEKLAPLFPRYIFVGMDLTTARWRSVNGTRGVSYLLMADDLVPSKVPSGVIENLRSQELSEGVVAVSSLDTFIKGDRVRIMDGVFKDQTATVDFLDDKARVQVLLNFMGREVNIALPAFDLEAA